MPDKELTEIKQLSNSFSTGGEGSNFENHVQASFLILMMSGCFAPCLPTYPIEKIKLQGKMDGYETDDFIVWVKEPIRNTSFKLLSQVKRTIAVTNSNVAFSDSIIAAWKDFNNSEKFNKNCDSIAIITGALSATDIKNVLWILEHARASENEVDFHNRMELEYFNAPKAKEKLEVFKYHIAKSNKGVKPSEGELHQFLKRLWILQYDLGNEEGVALSLLHSIIAFFNNDYKIIRAIFARAVQIVQIGNKSSAVIKKEDLPPDFIEYFDKKKTITQPKSIITQDEIISENVDYTELVKINEVGLLNFIGYWDEHYEADIKVVESIANLDYSRITEISSKILTITDSPISLKNKVWKISDRLELFKLFGARVIDVDLERMKDVCVSVFKEISPELELDASKRSAAPLYGITKIYSDKLKDGLSDGLAIIGNNPDVLENCDFL